MKASSAAPRHAAQLANQPNQTRLNPTKPNSNPTQPLPQPNQTKTNSNPTNPTQAKPLPQPNQTKPNPSQPNPTLPNPTTTQPNPYPNQIKPNPTLPNTTSDIWRLRKLEIPTTRRGQSLFPTSRCGHKNLLNLQGRCLLWRFSIDGCPQRVLGISLRPMSE